MIKNLVPGQQDIRTIKQFRIFDFCGCFFFQIRKKKCGDPFQQKPAYWVLKTSICGFEKQAFDLTIGMQQARLQ